MNKSRKTKSIITMLIVFMAISIVSSCEKADNRFSTYQAYFRYSPVSAKPNLHRACTSLGEFCSITLPLGKKYIIKSPSTPSVIDEIPVTALDGYLRPILGVGSGLIVGMPIIPEMLTQENEIVCYDMACPNCYLDYHTKKSMELRIGKTLCHSCQRNYDLNNQGIVASGDAGRSLFRYYVNYYSPTQTLTVSNK